MIAASYGKSVHSFVKMCQAVYSWHHFASPPTMNDSHSVDSLALLLV